MMCRWLTIFLLCVSPAAWAECVAPAKQIIAIKSDKNLYVQGANEQWCQYSFTFGRGGNAPKQYEGDRLTPEGSYTISPARPSTKTFGWFFAINYPNAADRAKGRTGGDVGLHGTPWLGVPIQFLGIHWTAGCLAVNNTDLSALRTLIKKPAPLYIAQSIADVPSGLGLPFKK